MKQHAYRYRYTPEYVLSGGLVSFFANALQHSTASTVQTRVVTALHG